jgi:CIC family chloride channel protein
VAAIAALTGLAARLVERFSPYAAGSGIPRVEAVAKGELSPAPFSLLPVKFFGGWLAIGGGLALGREGPSVQMGASIGSLVGRKFRLKQGDHVALLAACGGAGLATAFNAPIAGAVFVLEELIRRFDTRIAIAALGASCCAIAVARIFLGSAPDFQIEALPYSGLGSGLLFTGLGVLAGFAGMAYNAAILAGLSLAARIPWRPGWRAAVIGATVGMMAWFTPGLVGGGDAIRSAHFPGWRARPCSRCSSPSDTFWDPCLTRQALPAASLPLCLFWEPNSDGSSPFSVSLFCHISWLPPQLWQ